MIIIEPFDTHTVPLLLAGSGASLSEQALFALVSWPYSIKLLWAPIVDSVYLPSFGRRKSWVIPVQIMVGLVLIYLSSIVDSLLAAKDMLMLTVWFFSLYFLVATQDIAVDGWALSLLSKENTGYGSTCNSVGQTIGYFTSYTIFLAFNSKDFCNNYIRSVPSEEGLLSLSQFMYFWGLVFLIVTTLVWVFKKEEEPELEEGEEESVPLHTAYQQMLSIVKLPAILQAALVLLTARIGVSAVENGTSFKLLAGGVPKEHMAMFGVFFFPIEVVFMTYIGRFTSGPNPLKYYLNGLKLRYLFSIMYLVIIYNMPNLSGTKDMETGTTALPPIPTWFYVACFINFCLHRLSCSLMFTSQMAFFAQKSRLNPAVGATYMTLLNTIANLGSMWLSSPVLKVMDMLTLRKCISGNSNTHLDFCNDEEETEVCEAAGHRCVVYQDGYIITAVITLVLGLIWFLLMSSRVDALSVIKDKAWVCTMTGGDGKKHDSNNTLDKVVGSEEDKVKVPLRRSPRKLPQKTD